MLAPLACLRSLAQSAVVCLLVGAPLAYVVQVKSEESNGARIVNENRKPLVRHAFVTADLDDKGQAPAILDGETEPVLISAHDTAPRELKDRTVIVFYSSARGGWRLISDDPRQLDPSTMDYIEAFPARVRMEVATAHGKQW